MPTKITIVGNCQGPALSNVISPALPKDWQLLRCPAAHTLNDKTRPEAEKVVAQADVILTQPLSKGFGKLATQELKKLPNKPKIIVYPSIFFAGLLPQLTYLRGLDNKIIKGPLTDYHDLRIIESFLAGEDVETCLARLGTHDLRMVAAYQAARAETLKREEGLDIRSMDLMEAEMRTAPPLFTFNHPSNGVLLGVVRRALDKLGLPTKPLDAVKLNRDLLGNTRAAVPPAIPAYLGVSWRRDSYARDSGPLDSRALIAAFYELYAGIEDFPAVCRSNLDRFPMKIVVPDTAPPAMPRPATPAAPAVPLAPADAGRAPVYVGTLLADLGVKDFSALLGAYAQVQPGLTLCIDGGAGLGETAEKIFAHIPDPGLRVLGYEPNPKNVAAFRFADPRLEVVERALAAAAGPARFHIRATTQRESAYNRFLVKGTSNVGRLLAEGAGTPKEGETINVHAVRLEDDLADRGWAGAQFLKLDLQGDERAALEGMGAMLHQVHWMWLRYTGDTDLLHYLDDQGFALFDTEYLLTGDDPKKSAELFEITDSRTNSMGKTVAFGRRRHFWSDYATQFAEARKRLGLSQTAMVAVAPRHLAAFIDAAHGLMGRKDGAARLLPSAKAVAASGAAGAAR